MSKKSLIFWVLIILLAALVGCDQARSNFDKINFGMSRVEVEKLLGQPTRVEGDTARPTAIWTYGDKQLVVQYNKDMVQVKQVGPVAAAKSK